MSFIGLDVEYSAKFRKRLLKSMVAGGVIVILLMAYMLQPALVGPLHKVSTAVTIQVERDGEIVNTVVKEDDLILRNFGRMMYTTQMMKGMDALPHAWEPRNFFGEIIGIAIWNSTVSWTISDSNVESGRSGAIFFIGADNTTPDILDYDMEVIELDDMFAYASGFNTHTDGFSIYGQGLVNEEAPPDIREVGMGGIWINVQGDTDLTLLVRDVVNPIEIEELDLITITYRFIFGTGYTQNFMTWLLYLLYGVEQGYNNSIYMVDTSGESQQIRLYSSDTSEDEWIFFRPDYLPHDYGLWACLGNGNTAFNKNQYSLQGGGILMTAPLSYEPNEFSYYRFHAIFIPTAPMTAYEAGFYHALETTDGIHYFMFGRLTFSAKPIGAGISAMVTFTEEF